MSVACLCHFALRSLQRGTNCRQPFSSVVWPRNGAKWPRSPQPSHAHPWDKCSLEKLSDSSAYAVPVARKYLPDGGVFLLTLFSFWWRWPSSPKWPQCREPGGKFNANWHHLLRAAAPRRIRSNLIVALHRVMDHSVFGGSPGLSGTNFSGALAYGWPPPSTRRGGTPAQRLSRADVPGDNCDTMRRTRRNGCREFQTICKK